MFSTVNTFSKKKSRCEVCIFRKISIFASPKNAFGIWITIN